jgi:predicted RNase H-like HicB family nuclease
MCDNYYCYPAVAEQGKIELSVFFPDFDGCVTGGKDAKEALTNAREALSLHLYGMEQDGDALPAPTNPKDIRLSDNEYTILVDVNYGLFRERMDKRSIDRVVTLPRYLNATAKEKGLNVSQFLQKALKEHLGVR